MNTSAIALALTTTCRWYALNPGSIASLKATALAAMTCIRGPPWVPGKTSELSFFSTASLAFARIRPPRGPRRVLWVVVVVTSAICTGLGYSPVATRPATWAMSTNSQAPTASAMSRKRCQSTTRE